MPRYVVLRHDPSEANPGSLHWDFMLELGPTLRTWALQEEPSAGKRISSLALPDHRSIYLDYEGPVSGNRGHVSRWDSGDFEILAESPTALRLRLGNGRFAGTVEICQDDHHAQRWTFVFSACPPEAESC